MKSLFVSLSIFKTWNVLKFPELFYLFNEVRKFLVTFFNNYFEVWSVGRWVLDSALKSMKGFEMSNCMLCTPPPVGLLSNPRSGGRAGSWTLWQSDSEASQPAQSVCFGSVRRSNAAGRTPMPSGACSARRSAEDAGGHDACPVSHMIADKSASLMCTMMS